MIEETLQMLVRRRAHVTIASQDGGIDWGTLRYAEDDDGPIGFYIGHPHNDVDCFGPIHVFDIVVCENHAIVYLKD